MVPKHDHGYKRLFSHPEMVADLLRGFVHEDWVRDLDFSTLERVPNTFVTRKMRSRRESDVVWRVRWGRDRWLYVYLLLEFQSTVDPLWRCGSWSTWACSTRTSSSATSSLQRASFPPVLPLVLYNGHAPWGAAREIADLIEAIPGGLEQYRPRLRYCLLDE